MFALHQAATGTPVVTPHIIELNDVSKEFGGVTVLNAVSMRVSAGTYLALGGVSGAGKTTLLGILGLLEAPTSGEYRVYGEPTWTLGDRQLAALRNRTFGFVFQQFSLVPELSAWQNVARPLAFAGVPRREHKPRALELLDLLGLAGRAEHRASQLSGGEQQRVAIARALVNDPEVILADEPTGNLPREQWEPILDAFDMLHEAGKTIFLVTHNPAVARRAPRILWLRSGRLEDDSSPQSEDGRETGRSLVTQPAGTVKPAPEETGPRLEFMGKANAKLDGHDIAIQPRQADLLTMLAANPNGLTGEQLLLLVYGEGGRAGTLKAAVSKLRKLVAVSSQPYRLETDVNADFLRLEEALRAGNLTDALSLYTGCLLPQSEAPGVVDLRETLDSAMRHAVLTSGNGESTFRLAEVLADDLELWEVAADRLTTTDPRRALALARVDLLRKGWE